MRLPNGESTSATFLARLARGEDQAQWCEFLVRYGELILSIARRYGLQPADCEDVLQDSLIEMTRSLEGFQYEPSRGRFRNYLRQVVLRATYRRIRQKYATGRQQHVGDHPAEFESSEAVWELEWRRYHVRRALRTIEAEFSEMNRTAFMMCVAGRTPRGVAALLGISVDQVYQAKSRILKRLLAVVEQQVTEEG